MFGVGTFFIHHFSFQKRIKVSRKNTMEVNGDQKLFGYPYNSKYLLLCSAKERNSYRFGTTE